jgi:hypothetical protein
MQYVNKKPEPTGAIARDKRRFLSILEALGDPERFKSIQVHINTELSVAEDAQSSTP